MAGIFETDVIHLFVMSKDGYSDEPSIPLRTRDDGKAYLKYWGHGILQGTCMINTGLRDRYGKEHTLDSDLPRRDYELKGRLGRKIPR